MKPLWGIGVIISLFFILPSKAAAMGLVFYVATTGSDTNAGTSAAPFKTITKALTVAGAGDEIRVKPGLYTTKVVISGKNGTPNNPIVIVGDTTDPAEYPVFSGGDPNFTGSSDTNSAFHIQNSSWISLERISIKDSSTACVYLDNSHYVTLRRLILSGNAHGVLLRNRTSHLLMEYNDISQDYPAGYTWSQLKDSKWEGSGVTSFGGAGMNVIRNNYFHHYFNGVYMNKSDRVGNYYDANVWIYRNRFEDIVDDPYEPESYAFNNHFFHNTLINTHRLASFAPQASGLGPVYIYANYQKMDKDPSGEASSGRINSAFKIELNASRFSNGVFAFNNSLDAAAAGTNSYGIDVQDWVMRNFVHKNNAYRTLKVAINDPDLELINSVVDYDMSQKALGYAEPHGWPLTDPGFASTANEDGRLTANSAARGKSNAVTASVGFSGTQIIPEGADLGAYQYGQNDFHTVPAPIYVVPPGGEYTNFPANVPWPADTRGGYNPPSGPIWQNTTLPTPTPTQQANKPGDANADNIVNSADMIIWRTNYGQNKTGVTFGDFNNSGTVDGKDFVIWLIHFGL